MKSSPEYARFITRNRRDARRTANGIVASLITSYFAVGQPNLDADEAGATPKDINRLRRELETIRQRHERHA